MKWRLWLGILAAATLAVAAVLLVSGERNPARKPPNVVLVSLDTVRPDHLGCYGYKRNTSPNLDRFAKSCAVFENAYAQAPWTLPSHMSLFTSMIPSHNRVEDINQKLSEDVPTLAQILKRRGYRTAALVNDGQMKAHWGFDRGFDLWREYEVDMPEGTCENITKETLKWLEKTPQEPFFLFLHYYDPHDPYAPPENYKKAFGSTLSGADARSIVWDARYPGREIQNPGLMQEVIGAYDGEIAWMDEELGKLLKTLPSNTLVVIFSDHGEAFEEHGWTTHGAALYEEEVRAALMIRPPDAAPWPGVIRDPVMLLDVAPTVLSACGIEPPPHYEGENLIPVLEGKDLAGRAVFSETKRVLEGMALKMCMLHPWKLIYSLFDNQMELYKLPDEQTDLSKRNPAQAEKLSELIREWLSEEDYWIVYAKGIGLFEGALEIEGGRASVIVPVGFDHNRDSFRSSRNGREIRWDIYPDESTKALFFELAPRDARVSFDFKIDGRKQGVMEKGWPVRAPLIQKTFEPQADGFHVVRYRGRAASGRPATNVKLDEQTIRKLRSLGYLE